MNKDCNSFFTPVPQLSEPCSSFADCVRRFSVMELFIMSVNAYASGKQAMLWRIKVFK